MIELFYWPTPNGRKISIMLEESKIKYKITLVNINKGEQFKKNFLKLNFYNKIPVIIDHSNNKKIIESGAILIYLAKKSGKFFNKRDQIKILEWLNFQVGNVGPVLGQHHHFHHFNPGKSKYAESRFFDLSVKIYKVLNNHLSRNKFLAGSKYSIADIATFPWIARHNWHDINIKKHKYLCNWYNRISKRPAVIKGYDCLQEGIQIPKLG